MNCKISSHTSAIVGPQHTYVAYIFLADPTFIQ